MKTINKFTIGWRSGHKGPKMGLTKYRKGPQGTATDCTGLRKGKRTFNKKKIAKMLHFSAAFCCKRLLQREVIKCESAKARKCESEHV